MFCLKCGKNLKNAGICPFCQHDNSGLSENNYLKSGEMSELYKDDPDFELLFGDASAEGKPEQSNLVFSGEKTRTSLSDPDVSIESGGTRIQPENNNLAPLKEGGRQNISHCENDNSGRNAVFIESVKDQRTNVSQKNKLNFLPIVVVLLIAILVGIIIIVVKASGNSGQEANERDDRPEYSIQDATSQEGETMLPTDEGDIAQSSEPPGEEPATDEAFTETPSEAVAEETTEESTLSDAIETQGNRQQEWSDKAYELQDDVLSNKYEFFREYDNWENAWRLREVMKDIEPDNNFSDYNFLTNTDSRDNSEYGNDSTNNIQYVDNVLEGYTNADDSGRICSTFGDLNMYYYKEQRTAHNATQYLVTKGELNQESKIGVMYIYKNDDDYYNSLAYMALSFYGEIQYYVIDIDNEKVYDMDSVIEKLEQQPITQAGVG